MRPAFTLLTLIALAACCDESVAPLVDRIEGVYTLRTVDGSLALSQFLDPSKEVSVLRCPLRILPVLAMLAVVPAPADAQAPATAPSAVIAEVREAVRRYDDALRRADVAAVGQFFAPEYTFVNARGERLTRADRLANLRSGRTAVDSVSHAPQEEQIRPYGNVVVHTTLLTLGGKYSGKAQEGQFRALVVWLRRDGRWQQIASQLTPVASR